MDFLKRNIVLFSSVLVAFVIYLIYTFVKKNKTVTVVKTESGNTTTFDSSIKFAAFNQDNDQNKNLVNNNPLNIRDSKNYEFKGQTGADDRTFCKFESIEYGYRAAIKLLWYYNNTLGKKSIRQIIGTWAPESDGNNVSSYMFFVSSDSGILLDKPIDWSDKVEPTKLIVAMSQMENSIRPTAAQMAIAWELSRDGNMW